MRRIAIATGRKNNDEVAKKTHKKAEGLIPNSLLEKDKMLRVSQFFDSHDKEDRFEFKEGYIPMIILPNKFKSIEDLTYGKMRKLWRKILNSIEYADEILAIGFSFRDLHFNQIFFEAVRQRTKKPKLTIVSVDNESYISIAENIKWIPIKPVPFYGGLGEYVKSL